MESDNAITKQLCSLISDISVSCLGDPKWQLKSAEHCMYVCDAHLATGLRTCGIPALIDQHVPLEKRTGHV